MLTIIGLLLLAGGIGAAGLVFTEKGPVELAQVPYAPWIYLAAAVVGAVLLYLGRRPND